MIEVEIEAEIEAVNVWQIGSLWLVAGSWSTSGITAEISDSQMSDVRCTTQIPLLRRSRLFEADPSPGLWPPPFGLKGRRFDGQAKRLLYSGQTWTSYAGCPSLRGNLLTDFLTRLKIPVSFYPYLAAP
jgi:hypothetical protein